MFREKLEAIAGRITGAEAVSILGLDGIAVESINPGGVALEHIAAGMTSAYKSIQMTNAGIETGDLTQVSVTTRSHAMYLSRIVEDYYLLMVVSPGAYQGQVRHELKMAEHRLAGDLQ